MLKAFQWIGLLLIFVNVVLAGKDKNWHSALGWLLATTYLAMNLLGVEV